MNLASFVQTIALLAIALTSAAADHHGDVKKAFALEGAWKAAAETDNGTNHYTFTFKETESKWSGQSEDEDGNTREMDRIKIEGNKITLETDVESNGQTGIIRVTVEGDESGNALKGKWAVVDSADTEYMSGEFSAERLFTLELAGDWTAVATVGEEEMQASVHFKEADSKLIGSFTGEDEKKVKFTKIETKEKDVTLEFSNDVNGTDLDFRISAEAKSPDSLEGKWVVFDPTGQEGYSGKWVAQRVVPFILSGTWSATSVLPDGSPNISTLTIEEKEDAYSGKVGNDTTEIELKTVALKDDKVTITFPFGEATVTITSEVKEGKLVGKWALPTPEGDLSGKWSAELKEEE